MTDVTIFEVGPRDGLQNEAVQVLTKDKVALIDHLSASGISKIEATSFVSPKWVPQLSDGRDVMAQITRREGVTYAALVPNEQGYRAALSANVAEIAVFAAASESFSKRNTNCTIAESLARFAPVIRAATQDGILVRGYVSCVTACPYEGAISNHAVRDVAKALFDLGCYQVSLGDTIGAAKPTDIEQLLDLLCKEFEPENLAGHFHDTNGLALRNVAASLPYGLRTFDSSVAGLGGCPFAPGSKGNLATSDLVEFLDSKGLTHGVDLDLLSVAEELVADLGLGI